MPKAQAVATYDGFAATIPAGLKADFKVLTTSMKNWRREILAYFDHPISNAYTEALNGVAKTINRAGRGYSFDVLRARLLFGKGVPPQAPTPEPIKMDPTRRISQMERKHAIAAAGNRRQSCGGVFEPAELQIHQTLPLVAGEHRKVMAVCRPCHERFHTSALTHTHGRSTS